MKENNQTFHYTYSAQQQDEIKAIRNKYAPPQENKMDQLRKLDLRTTQKAQTWSIVCGVIGALILGTGMSLTLTEPSALSHAAALLIGIPVGLIGIVLVALAYPVHNYVLKKERQRIAPEILRLTDELLK